MKIILKNIFAVNLRGYGEVCHRLQNNFTTACGALTDNTWRLINTDNNKKLKGKFECYHCEKAYRIQTESENN